ncbi:MAG: hypothetical protein AB1758_23170 [Candidatus Eremiobacterota bacterium]
MADGGVSNLSFTPAGEAASAAPQPIKPRTFAPLDEPEEESLDQVHLEGELDPSAMQIMNLRRKATELGFLGPEGSRNGNSLVPEWERGGSGTLHKLLLQDSAQMTAGMQAADKQRQFFEDMTQRTTMRFGGPGWPGFGNRNT